MIENIDATIIAQRPKMRPYIDTMRQNIADALCIEIDQVNVKATTEEGLGFTGDGEGDFFSGDLCDREIYKLQQYGCLFGLWNVRRMLFAHRGGTSKMIIRKLEQSEHIATRKLWEEIFPEIRRHS